jgi:DNA-binding transcriptional ArsR family regulator
VRADAEITVPAALIGDRTRATFLLALAEAEPLAGSELARRAGVGASTASLQLAKLAAGGLVHVEARGRQRHYRLASPAVGHAIEALARVAPERSVRSLREAVRSEALLFARTCYDHLAGRLGVALTEALERSGCLVRREALYDVTGDGEELLATLGVDVPALRAGRRALARPCLDWSEGRDHLAGALGAAVCERLLDAGWIERLPGSRAVRLTPAGDERLRGIGLRRGDVRG